MPKPLVQVDAHAVFKSALHESVAPSDAEGEQQPEVQQQETQQQQQPTAYQYAKYNIQIETPTYDQDLYDAQLHDPDWTKEETDYLVAAVRDFGQKWPVVVDRYEYHPDKPRSMEQLKSRYYTVSAKVLANHTPISSMTAAQYNLYSTLTCFNSVQETSRKKLAEGHLLRTQLEVDEENVLLAELQRIMINQQQLENERTEIRDRLDYPSTNSNPTAQYTTSQQLGQLFQQLLQADRMKKDRRLKALGAETPTSAGPTSAHLQGASSHRDSISSATAGGNRRLNGGRDSIVASSANGPSSGLMDPTARALTPHQASRYFITQHDRLSSGVSFASDRLHRARTAKSIIQTEKISAILSHLRIPDVIPLPTQRVIEEFERLMQKVHLLLDMRKVADKEEQEIRVKEAERRVKEAKEGGGASVSTSAVVEAVKEEGDDGNGKTNGSGSGSTSRKRSASVLSSGGGGDDARTAAATKRPKT
jgi:DNA methyltransferase 1-associated protein 1